MYGTNNRDQVVGSYMDADGREHGFLLERERVTVIDHPDAPEDPAAGNTAATDLNDRGQIVGYYTDAGGPTTATVRQKAVHQDRPPRRR